MNVPEKKFNETNYLLDTLSAALSKKGWVRSVVGLCVRQWNGTRLVAIVETLKED